MLGDAEERCTQMMHQKVQLEESVQVNASQILTDVIFSCSNRGI